MVMFAILFFLVSLVITILSFVFFGSGGPCHLQRFFICFQIVHAILMFMGSILFHRGIFVPSVVVLYSTFTIWCALMSDPSATCNKLAPPTDYTSTPSQIVTMVLGLIISAISLLRAAVSTGGSFSKLFSFKEPESEENSTLLSGSSDDDEENEKMRSECSDMWNSHLVFLLASAYMATVLTNWSLDPNEQSRTGVVDTSLAAMWIKTVSAWITNAIFGWTLVAPFVLGRCRRYDKN